jgi:hypothetical protein
MKEKKTDSMYSQQQGWDSLAWEVNPFRDEPAKGTAVLLVAISFVVVATFFAGPVIGLISLFVFSGSIGSFFVTTRYRLTPEEVEVRSMFQRVTRPWGDFRKMHQGRAGVSLSPFSGRHLLEPYRSVMLRYGDRRDEILGWVGQFGPKAKAKEKT